MSEVAKYVYVDDKDHIERIKNGLKKKLEKFGKEYCPCVAPAAHNEDTICPCKEYRTTGDCHCKMYKE
jgi:ferredoxin-thioredoxin reductase catalytic subunit